MKDSDSSSAIINFRRVMLFFALILLLATAQTSTVFTTIIQEYLIPTAGSEPRGICVDSDLDHHKNNDSQRYSNRDANNLQPDSHHSNHLDLYSLCNGYHHWNDILDVNLHHLENHL